jgi:hypothetical protein
MVFLQRGACFKVFRALIVEGSPNSTKFMTVSPKRVKIGEEERLWKLDTS